MFLVKKIIINDGYLFPNTNMSLFYFLFYVLDYIFYIELKIGHVQLNAEHQTLIMKLIPWYKNTTRVC